VPTRVFSAFACVFALVACSSDDSDGDDGAPATEWKCFEGARDCWCVELTPGNIAGSSEPEVDACSYTNCMTYREGDARHCTCEPAPITPPSVWEDPMPVAECPLG
jgi:hypothetical protein